MSTVGPPLNSMSREERQQLLELAKAKRRAREAGGSLPASPGRRVHPMVHSLQANEAATAKLEQELAAKTDEAARVRILSLPAAESLRCRSSPNPALTGQSRFRSGGSQSVRCEKSSGIWAWRWRVSAEKTSSCRRRLLGGIRTRTRCWRRRR